MMRRRFGGSRILSEPYNMNCTMYSVQCTVYSVQCTVYSVQCTVYFVQCTVYSVQCTVYSVILLLTLNVRLVVNIVVSLSFIIDSGNIVAY